MGSQPSKQETAIEACLADFPDHERANVLDLFDKLCKGATSSIATSQDPKRSGHHGNDQDTIDPQQFNAFFSPLLPPPLLTCFRVTMQMHSAIHDSSSPTTDTNSGSSAQVNGGASNRATRRQGLTRSTSVDSTSRISKYGWVMTIHRLSKTSIEEQAGLSFMLQTHDKSLESFIANVTRAVMVFWLAGEIESWKDIPEEDVEGTTGFLLTRHLKKGSGKSEFESDDEGDNPADADGLDKAGQDWLETATKRDGQGQPSGKEMSRSAFLNWYQQTVEYQIMFTILIQNLFLGQSTLTRVENNGSSAGATPRKRTKMPVELENKLCQKNYIAPRIRGGIDAAPHYSRLLTVADFFQLRYALPTPIYNMTASTGSAKKGSSGGGGGGGGLDQNLSETRPTPPLKLLFSSKTSGASFSTLLQKITYQGPTLVVMKDEDGYIFGAYADQDWEQGPKFYGTDRSFLFTIRPTFRIYRPSQGINSNFQYLDSGTKTLPNGIGFGGQLRYFGLWLASDFQTGQSAAEPLCSTFQSPRLSKQQNFKLDEMEVWQVHPSTIDRDDLPKHSAMDTHPDAVALLEMANRKMYSKDVRAPENIYDDDD
ncbi:hypothetical protein BG015_009061 [Linnemannia schmuckeri]|uniref:MTOR-associated protein MEAK7 n=1 Tax=Linnemannia schmuckeri TaxID=64567 RepID=A0A9P5VA29_9FUNG|nr:hypothetical protein BG015_009061 [Linnemannia schmuckeri]